MRHLPTCADRTIGESIPEYQSRVLQFLLRTSCTATLTDEQLSQAEVAGCRVCAQTKDQTVLTVVSAARHTIAAVLKFRAGLSIQEAIASVETPAERPNAGPMAPLEPVPIVRPPAPSYAAVEINF